MKDSKLIIRQKPPKGEDGYHVFSIRIKNEIFRKIEEVSAQSGYSRNQLIGMFLSYALEHCELKGHDH